MPLTTSQTTVSVPVAPQKPVSIWGDKVKQLILQNNSGQTIYLGSVNVTTSNYGHKLSSGATLTFDNFDARIYAITSGSPASIHVMSLR